MPRREAIRSKLTGKGDKVDKFHALIAVRARHRSAAMRIFVNEPCDDAVAESTLIVEHIMRYSEALSDLPGIIDVLPRTAGTRSTRCFCVIVKLQCDADDLRTRARGKSRCNGTVDAARHGDDDPGIASGAAELKINEHRKSRFRSSLPEFHS